MGSLYEPQVWHDLFVVIGTAAGSLVGLLFIVMSLHHERLRARNDHNMRATIDGAKSNTIHLLLVLLEAAIVLTPQPLKFIGAELLIVNFYGLHLPVLFAYKYLNKNITISHQGGFPLGLILAISGLYLVAITAGIVAFRGLDWGLYLLAASCTLKIVRSVLTAWMLMFGVQ